MSWILDGVCGCSLWKSTIIFYGYEHSIQHQMSPQMAGPKHCREPNNNIIQHVCQRCVHDTTPHIPPSALGNGKLPQNSQRDGRGAEGLSPKSVQHDQEG
jgi:hypothetical protein